MTEPLRLSASDDLSERFPGPVLVVAPHPDDEAIGPGGTIARLTAAGTAVHVLYLTSGEQGVPGTDPKIVLEWRERDAHKSAAILGVESLTFWELPDGRVLPPLGEEDEWDDWARALDVLSKRFGDLATSLGAKTVLIPHRRESHVDHRHAVPIVDNARSLGMLSAAVMTYEVWTPLGSYAVAVDITDTLHLKRRAIRAQESQVSRIFFDEAAEALARFRGELHNRPHGPYAEVFGTL